MAYENKYLDGAGLSTLWEKIKSYFKKSASGNRAEGDIVTAAAQGQVNSSTYAITQSSTTVTDNVVKAKIKYNATDAAIDFTFEN